MINPKLIITPFANDGQRDDIPVTREASMPTQKATWDLGFPPITMLPESAGGLPPRGRDFNGVLNQISEMLVHFAKGGRIKFSDSYASAIGGYSKGAILQSDDETRDYQSLIDANSVNFNTATQAQINAAWKLISTVSLATDISGKLDKTAVTQYTGNSKSSVMSQKAVTDALNTKQATGDYATVNQLNYGLSTRQPTGDYLLRSELPRNTANKQVNGWWRCADTGLIMQWGRVSVGWAGYVRVNWPIQFPNLCASVQVSITGDGGESGANFSSVQTGTVSVTGANIGYDRGGSYWLAIGY